ncbi:MAG: hypothetical protein A3C50_02935 [Candidatus Staskawiczbacteria bacterium RIFCSPHIGHO2_02_FULL_43_16]|uniref:Uncharacterized protein n=1 Tax=Candidatus Staskawiczbacteria bacterium RIFCSPHIGHO2_01_FULL_41_41 TaxID=1802203 RepID=A0A1G2HSL1_9BACT|nr:MAG: hypothetical protein A2822_01160 [Candidatus Staskawiczbacteria bacterium RIFCSPHIGHO2_01_FULL_41_41]OGZ68570.1 MAG: hypothetical protein A3C50_02935 [Candidatus Staskawiczbacteria bacterium RIFCSPHIGHO2_02_FULL_43_16]
MGLTRKEKPMKVIVPLGRSVEGIISDVQKWLKTTDRGEITSILLVTAPGDQLPTPPALEKVAPVERLEVTRHGDFYPEDFDYHTVVVINGGTTFQQWAIAKWWWQKLYNHGTSYQWESYRWPDEGKWDAIAIDVQRDGVRELASA